ncbi:MAG: succinate dehydrogenase assembly factor 2 [Zoogloeaceae bacterium]|jgi:succinate dehydrogenase flavin-adding protein (antitoxin of CptAB toxin-antitoxin module)|nr:succinate dehydrogenase assembly factor 2 [Zoogloeaceae bacterium]
MERAAFQRLRWRCTRRGLLEVDVTLGRFLEEGFGKLSDAEARAFARLADYEDLELWHLISGQKACEDAQLAPIVAMLQKCRGNAATAA